MSKRTCATVAATVAVRLGISLEDALILARAEKVLHSWSELECGNSDNRKSWCISRDEETGVPYMQINYHDENQARMVKIADRETGALKRVAKVCERNKLHFWQQGDPRGCALYVSREVLTDENYSSRGIAVC